jgi:quinol monooxygenase YgiN
MIIRLVKMTFEVEKMEAFLTLFKERQAAIKDFPGCLSLQLLIDNKLDGTIFTYSQWESADALENYRQSDLFKDTWKQTKKYFKDRPFAWSTTVFR